MLIIREGHADDLPFLQLMLREACLWNEPGPLPEVESFLAGMPPEHRMEAFRPDAGERAVIAEDDGQPIGAAWYHYGTDEHHSWGYVDPQTPELGVAVARTHRRRGVGRALLIALIEVAKNQGAPAISLSVDPHNHARQLYESLGFVCVGESGTSWTLKLELTA